MQFCPLNHQSLVERPCDTVRYNPAFIFATCECSDSHRYWRLQLRMEKALFPSTCNRQPNKHTRKSTGGSRITLPRKAKCRRTVGSHRRVRSSHPMSNQRAFNHEQSASTDVAQKPIYNQWNVSTCTIRGMFFTPINPRLKDVVQNPKQCLVQYHTALLMLLELLVCKPQPLTKSFSNRST